MDIKLETSLLEILINFKGAELTSIKGKLDNLEYLWNADPQFWARHAPLLFPIVGKVNKNQYQIDRNKYDLGQHGFARDFDFRLVERTANNVVLRLESSEDSLRLYPYQFQLDIEYLLKDNLLEIAYKVKNTDNKNIFFSIGAHPGFSCPFTPEESMEDYYFEFDEQETAPTYIVSTDGLLTGETRPFLDNTKVIKLVPGLFQDDALIFKGLKSNKISLKSTKTNKSITVDYTGFPWLGLWSKAEGAPFVCVEPWFGHADFQDFHGDFRDKDGIIELSSGEQFISSYSIHIKQ